MISKEMRDEMLVALANATDGEDFRATVERYLREAFELGLRVGTGDQRILDATEPYEDR